MPISNVPPSGAGADRRRREEQNRAKLRARTKFDDQKMVNKVYRWVKERVYEAENYPQNVRDFTNP